MSSHETPGTAGSDPQRETAPGNSPQRREITVRRAPKYVPFLILGGLVGIGVAAVLAYAFPGDANYDTSSVFGFFMVLCAAGGAILGAAVALVLDRMSVRRAQRAVVESVPESADGQPDDDGDHRA